MSSDTPRKKATRQVKQRLDSLRAAGVEYLPATAAPLPAADNALDRNAAAPTSPNPPSTRLDVTPIAVPAGGTLFGDVDGVPADPDARRQALDVLAADVAGCPRCPELFSTRTQTVFGVGPVDADLCVVGEAPGAEEDRTGQPFVGAAGQLLNRILSASGFRREDVYICNTLKCRPPNNRTPTPEECGNCRPFFDRQLDLVKPKWLLCLGAVAAQNVLATKTGITKLRGKVHRFRGIPVVCTFHPAYLLRNPDAKKDCWEDMKMLLREMGRPVPGPKQG
jgi:DNA polymerase